MDEDHTGLWRPLGFDGPQGAVYDALHEGVPVWLHTSLWLWLRARFSRTVQVGRVKQPRFATNLLREAERVCRFSAPYVGSDVSDGMRALQAVVAADHDLTLRLVDYLLTRLNGRDEGLDAILQEAGSAWRVGVRSGRAGLARRVPAGAQLAADAVMSESGHAGERLASAWQAAFGLDPSPSMAYALAIKAVEDAAASEVSPADSRATLGKIVAAVRDQGGWGLPLTSPEARTVSEAALLSMMQALWAGQSDRHGGNPSQQSPVTQDAAEAAVLLAVPLVYWFSVGQARRV